MTFHTSYKISDSYLLIHVIWDDLPHTIQDLWLLSALESDIYEMIFNTSYKILNCLLTGHLVKICHKYSNEEWDSLAYTLA